MSDIGLEQMTNTPIICDNQGAIALVKNPTNHLRMMHIDIPYHFIRENVQHGVIGMKYMPTQRMIDVVLKKALPKP